MKTAYRIIIQGLVQGVGYRWYAVQHANRLNLEGYVANLVNGDVEVFVQGNNESIQEFIAKLRKGPSFSQVNNVVINDADLNNNFNTFNVQY